MSDRLTPEREAEIAARWQHIPTDEQPRIAVTNSSRGGSLLNALGHARHDVPALLAEVQRLRTSRWDATEIVARLESGLLETQTELSRAQARIAELEADVASKRAETRASYTALIAQAEQDGDYAGAYDAWRLLQDREEKWKREDATTKPNPTAEEAS